jgi:HK97 family phage portal protein
MTYSAVWQACRILSESVAQLPMYVCEKEKNGDKIIRSDHAMYKLVHDEPNPYMTQFNWTQKCMYDLCVNGNSYVQIIRNQQGKPIELMPLDHQNITIKILEGVIYYSDAGTGQTIDMFDMLHFKTMSKDGIVGLSPIDTLANTISNGLGLLEYSNSYFRNGAKVSGVLQTEASLSQESVDRLRNSFNMNYSSIGDSNKTLVLEEGLKFNAISLSNEASQFLSSREFSIAEIARCFSLPPHLLRDLSKSSFNNIQEQSREFVQFSLMPYIRIFETELTRKLFSNGEKGKLFIEINTNSLLRGNPQERAEYYRTMLNIGALSVNEIRRKENMNSVDEGDNLFMQMNMTTLKNITESKNEDDAIN